MLEDFLGVLALFVDAIPITAETKLVEIYESSACGFLNFVTAAVALECMYLIYIPDELTEHQELSVAEFVAQVERLPKQDNRLWIAKRLKVYAEAMGPKATGLFDSPREN